LVPRPAEDQCLRGRTIDLESQRLAHEVVASAGYARDVGDLQCAARIVLVRERPSGVLRGPLAEDRLAATYDAPVDLDELADRHRGEAVLVVGEHGFGPATVVLVEVDADGRRVTSWDGSL